MIVVDASVIVNALARGENNHHLSRLGAEDVLIAPSHCRAEAANGLRGLHLGGKLPAEQFIGAWNDLIELPLDERPIPSLMARVFELRHNMTALDTFYIALAEDLALDVLTSNARWTEVPGVRCRVETV